MAVTKISKLAQLTCCGIPEIHTYLKNVLEMFCQQNHLVRWDRMLPEERSGQKTGAAMKDRLQGSPGHSSSHSAKQVQKVLEE